MNELVSRRVIESMNERIHGQLNEWMDGWMNEGATSLLSYFFAARPLRWGTCSLSCFFSEQPCPELPLS